MRADEFDDYLSYFIGDYTAEIAENFNLSHALAAEIARTEIAKDLPAGTNTSGQCLFCIVNTVKRIDYHVGYIWYRLETEVDRIFVCDFHILPSCQNQGLGKLALAALDSHLIDVGVSQIRLRVAIENSIALHVYESSGFRATGISMFKELTENSSPK